MDALRQEIAQELERPRVDRDKLYGILTKLTQVIEEGGLGGGVAGPRGPAGPEGPQGPRGKPGADGKCECKCVSATAPVATPAAPKKTTRSKKATA
jgi:hypothetical protein